jgi:type IV pilus assembly protein PilW
MSSVIGSIARYLVKRDQFTVRPDGFSLVELMVAIAISSIVLGAIASVFAGLSRSYTTQNVAAQVQEGMRASMDFMAEDLMMAGFDPLHTAGAGIVSATASSIDFTVDRNMNGSIDATDSERINYFLSGNQLRQRLNNDNTTDDSVVDNVAPYGFILSYFDESNTALPPPLSAANLAAVRTIQISLTVQEAAGRGGPVNRTYTTRVRCRNIGL